MVNCYCLFGYKFEIDEEHYWSSIEERVIRLSKLSSEELKQCIDIVFLMSKAGQGQYIYNHIEQHLI